MADDFAVLPVLSASYALMWPFMVVNITLISYCLYKLHDVTYISNYLHALALIDNPYISNYLHALALIDNQKNACIASVCLSTAGLLASLYFVYRAMGAIYKARREKASGIGVGIGVNIGKLAELAFPIAFGLIMFNVAITPLILIGLNRAGHISITVNCLAQISNIAILMAPVIIGLALYYGNWIYSLYEYLIADKKASTNVINNPVSDQSNMGYTSISSDVDDVLMSAKIAPASSCEMSSKNEEATPLCI